MTIRRSIIDLKYMAKAQLKHELEEVIVSLKKNNENEKILNFIISNKDEIVEKAQEKLEQNNNTKLRTFYPME